MGGSVNIVGQSINEFDSKKKEKERLLHLLVNSPFPKDIVQYNRSDAIECVFYISDIESFVDYLLDNGVIAPPCKVGDTVWYIVAWFSNGLPSYHVLSATVSGLKLNKKEIEYIVIKSNVNGTEYATDFKNIYKTKKAAEKALKEREYSENEV